MKDINENMEVNEEFKLEITEIPKDIYDAFIETAKKRTCDNYGWLLTELWEKAAKWELIESRILDGEFKIRSENINMTKDLGTDKVFTSMDGESIK